ncbi:MAG TPA: hypothetical protein VN688_15925, partial [Gemmataceae bacterium]|nr:hypothetical protein [Gemmataceae bacterium]
RGKSSPAAREILTRCAGNPKSEIRNPKSEIRNPKEIETRNQKSETTRELSILILCFCYSFGFRISDFGFPAQRVRISRAAGEDFPRSG